MTLPYSRLASIVLLMALLGTARSVKADDVTGLVDVTLYSKNDDYLSFTIHRQQLPLLFALRELICTVDLDIGRPHPASKLFQLTQIPPHFFAHDDRDAVLYFPHGERAAKISAFKCIANSLHAVIHPPESKGDSNAENKKKLDKDTELVAIDLDAPRETYPITVEPKTKVLASTESRLSNIKELTDGQRGFLNTLKSLEGTDIEQPKMHEITRALVKNFSEVDGKVVPNQTKTELTRDIMPTSTGVALYRGDDKVQVLTPIPHTKDDSKK